MWDTTTHWLSWLRTVLGVREEIIVPAITA